ncbi:homocysteine S-methyltransferase [Microbacterium sp. SGAir0570]|uniref:homocysteine S-methyltransferase n=1 Tax=Microbacterium sp. SGAir0570 TaxID=2070348 RepID=UPI0010CCF91C|nr:homocysteine S-methyltransferase [Microbacterium sp. SGAir0570]QCR39370.1 homocysteine S-methyltransferase [Microbacterium sp. SGAir0570]
MSDVATALSDRPLLLDGGLGTTLEAGGHDLSGELWSARVLSEAPADVRAAHARFAAAGADILTTASYQIGFDNLAAAGFDAARTRRLLDLSVRVAREGGAEAGREVRVAASVGPFGATRADGSEYTGDYSLTAAQLERWHRRRLDALVAAEPDLLAVETIASPAEAEAVARAVEGIGIPTWVALSAASTAFDEASLRETLVAISRVPGVVAVGVNCCPPAAVASALTSAAAVPFVVYPNSGESWDADSRVWTGEPGHALAEAEDWIRAGARIVGGCCRTTPDDIAALARRLR